MIRALRPLAVALLLAGPAPAASIVTDWLEIGMPVIEGAAPYPTTSARAVSLMQTAIYEAWAAYHPTATGVASGRALAGTGGPPSVAARREAISHAAFSILVSLAPHRRRHLEDEMAVLGYAPADATPPAVLGRRAAAAVLSHRLSDGANAEGAYADTSRYRPRDPSDPAAWRPVMFAGEPQMAMTPHWGRVLPFALPRADALRPTPPPAPGSAAFDAQVRAVLKMSAELDDAGKAEAEYWVAWTSHPASHLFELTRWVSFRRELELDEDVVLFFAVSNVLLDASVAAWDAKYHYDYVRPETAIAALGDREVTGWVSPSRRAGTHLPNEGRAIDWSRAVASEPMAARDWRPYIPTPPFPEYVSGHSAFTAAWARAMELVLGDDAFGYAAAVPRLYVEDRALDPPVTLRFETFWDAAESSGASRLHGGVHWPVGNEAGLTLGRAVAEAGMRMVRRYVGGGARPAGAARFPTRGTWSHRPVPGYERARFDAGTALVVAARETSAPWRPQAGVWRTRQLDPLPAGRWEVRMEAEGAGISGRAHVGDAIVRLVSDEGGLRAAFWTDGTEPIQFEFGAVLLRPATAARLTGLTLRRLRP